jgi:Putative adhesin
MATIRTRCSTVHTIRCAARLQEVLYLAFFIAVTSLACVQSSLAQSTPDFHRTLAVTPAEMVTLDVDVAIGELQVSYGRDGEVAIVASARSSAEVGSAANLLPAGLNIEQIENHIKIHTPDLPAYKQRVSVLYRIDVPYRTELSSRVSSGRQVITGILGPVNAVTNKGDIKAAYISNQLEARVGAGNLDLQVIGGYVHAIASAGNISCSRLSQGVSAETGDGDISLTVVGPSIAIVKEGKGRIEVGGARDSLTGSTDKGDLHVKAVPHQNWQLRSQSGDVRLELPPSAKFELEASTDSGRLQFDRDDITGPQESVLQFSEPINGGGKRVVVHTGSGTIMIR